MRYSDFIALEKAISTSRLSTYKNHHTVKNENKLIENYMFNAKISENFYFLLQNLEVTLRNAIYDSYSHAGFAKDFFYIREQNTKKTYNREYHSYACWKMIGTVKYHLIRDGVVPTDGKIVSELNFGFWTTLLEENHYKTLIWRRIFKQVFPYYPHGNIIDTDVDAVSKKVNAIRQFRNRIFHYEPIFNRPNLKQDRDNILEIIGWISPEMRKISEIYDEFNDLIRKKRRMTKLLARMREERKPLGRKSKKQMTLKSKYR
jgi:hypothetical protein